MTPTLEQLTALLERVQKATGQDRELDYDLTKAFMPGQMQILLADIYPGGRASAGQPVTSSIDSALALVERVLPGHEEIRLNISLKGGPHCNAMLILDTFRQDVDKDLSIAPGRTAPLAILAATLTALIAQAKERGE